MNKTILILGSFLALGLAPACGSDASSGPGAGRSGPSGGGNTGCANAMQFFPPDQCDVATRTCLGSITVPPDAEACDACITTSSSVGQDPNSELTKCSCQNCAVLLGACFDSATWEGASGDATRDGLCRAIVECGQTNGCQGTNCYLDPSGAAGPCVPQIEAAAAASDGCAAADAACVITALGNPASGVMRASAAGACIQGDSSAMPPVTGHCGQFL